MPILKCYVSSHPLVSATDGEGAAAGVTVPDERMQVAVMVGSKAA
jgi:hypothetical protein